MTSEQWIGRRIRAYEIVALLGAGGMGEVYRARDTKLQRDVAIKVLPPSFAQDRLRLSRFEQEARALAALNHPNIGAIYGFEETEGRHALVLELVEGPTLADRIKTRAIPLDEGLRIARQIAVAVEAAHGKGIIHRDLKPANIKVTPEGAVKILDFGLAKAFEPPDASLSQLPTRTQDGLIVGTPAYMSPEQARGESIDKRTDIWAFGCILFEILTRRRAFPGQSFSDTVAATLANEPEWEALPTAVSPHIRTLLRRCLEKDAKRRLHDIADARIELDDTSASVEVGSVHGRSRRASTMWILVGGIAGLVLGFTGRSAIAPPSPKNNAPRLSHPFRLTNSAAQEFGPAISPDGKWVAYYSNMRGPSDVWVRFLNSGATLNLTASLHLDLPSRAGQGGLAISPDGSTIAFNARPDPTQAAYDTWLIPAPVGGVPRKLLQVLTGMQWSPDGNQVTAIRAGSFRGDALVLANSDGTNQRDLIAAQGGRHIHWPIWSADGKYIYFIYTFDSWNDEPSEIYRVSVNGGTPAPVVTTTRRAIFPLPMPGGDLAYFGNPDSIGLAIWWQPANGGASRPLTIGIGEYAEGRISADGAKIVSTLYDLRQSLALLPVPGGMAKSRAITDGYTADVEPSLDFTSDRLVFSSSRSGHQNLWLSHADGSQPTPLTNEAVSDSWPSFSPDGRQVAFVSDRRGRRGIWVIATEGGAPKLVATVPVLRALTWSRDGKRILYSVPGGDAPRLESVSVADGKVEPFSTPTAADAPAWSPTADVIAYLEPTSVMASGPSSVPAARLWLRFVDAQGNLLYPKMPMQSFINGSLAWAPDGRRLAAVWFPANGVGSVWIVEPESPAPYKKLTDLPQGVRPRGIGWTLDGSGLIIGKQESASDIVLFDVTR